MSRQDPIGEIRQLVEVSGLDTDPDWYTTNAGEEITERCGEFILALLAQIDADREDLELARRVKALPRGWGVGPCFATGQTWCVTSDSGGCIVFGEETPLAALRTAGIGDE
jgi:hypothetical protein